MAKWISYENIIFFPHDITVQLKSFPAVHTNPSRRDDGREAMIYNCATNGTIINACFSATATQSSLSLLAFFDFGLTERKLKLKGHCF